MSAKTDDLYSRSGPSVGGMRYCQKLCQTSLLSRRASDSIRCAGYGSFGVWLSDLLINGANRLIGTGRMVVVLCSLESNRLAIRI